MGNINTSPAQNHTPPVKKSQHTGTGGNVSSNQYSGSGLGSNSVSSNSFDSKFKANQKANDPFGQVEDVGKQAFNLLGSGLTKGWGFASSLASSASEKVQKGQLSDLANSSLNFVGSVAKTSLNTASNVVNTVTDKTTKAYSNMNSTHSEKPEFWDNFGAKNDSKGNFAGFGGFKQDSEMKNVEQEQDDLYWDNFGKNNNNKSGGFGGFDNKKSGDTGKNKDGWDDDW